MKNEPLTQAAEMDFSDFVALYKSFSLRFVLCEPISDRIYNKVPKMLPIF